ncbi:MAG: cytochrome C oxidase subunit IV [Crocinitomicaceae bacterium]|nr:cytochrome C oxidase subunit IV [Crocinitomicaceae bacterium]|tara:strand:- start:50273 stop:50629 length:357 start_codon:yes stop_codon:yes gene_type:complete
MERDDIIEYSLDGHHNEDTGVKIRKKIWFVTGLLTLITAIEVALGMFIKQDSSLWLFVKWGFIVMTVIKAAYIVLVFMHLGDERKSFKYVILIPYVIFIIYLIFILLWEGMAVYDKSV